MRKRPSKSDSPLPLESTFRGTRPERIRGPRFYSLLFSASFVLLGVVGWFQFDLLWEWVQWAVGASKTHQTERVVVSANAEPAGSGTCDGGLTYYLPPVWQTRGSYSDASYDDPSKLVLSTSFPTANVQIRTPDGTSFVLDTTVMAGSEVLVALDTSVMQTHNENTPERDKGFIITSDVPLQVLYVIDGVYNNNLLTVKGEEALGTSFRAGSQVNTAAPDGGTTSNSENHFVSVMATEDSTTVTFTFSIPMAGITSPHTVVLQSGESYLIRDDDVNQSVSGMLIQSDKLIVAISGSQHTKIEGVSNRDGGVDQLVPSERVGTDYVVVRGEVADNQDYAIIVAIEDSTQIFVDGGASPVATLAAGAYHRYNWLGNFGDVHSIRTSKAAYVFHVSGLTPGEGEMGMALVSPVGPCRGSNYVEFVKMFDNSANYATYVIVENTGLSTLRFNDTLYTNYGVTARTVPGLPGYSAVVFTGASLADYNAISCDSYFFAAQLNGQGGRTGTYGYLNSFEEKVNILDPDVLLSTSSYFVDTVCAGQTYRHCLLPQSCGTTHRIINFTGGAATASIVVESDSCIVYTPVDGFSGTDIIKVELENENGIAGSVCLQFYVCSGVPEIQGVPVDLTIDCNTSLPTVHPTVRDDCDPSVSLTYQEVAIYPPTSDWSSGTSCDLLHAISEVTCTDNGSPADPSDDTIAFSLAVIGQHTGSQWRATIAGVELVKTYNSVHRFGPYPASSPILFTISDTTDPSCSVVVRVVAGDGL
ncbi:MAG: IgGFc-binding protein [Bacteroidota bacterium]